MVVVVYDRGLSTAVSFEPDATTDADRFARERIVPRLYDGDLGGPEDWPPFLVIATDGELYGHHQPFRDQFLARLVDHATWGSMSSRSPRSRVRMTRHSRRRRWSSGRRGVAITASPAGTRLARAFRMDRGSARCVRPSTTWPPRSTLKRRHRATAARRPGSVGGPRRLRRRGHRAWNAASRSPTDGLARTRRPRPGSTSSR